MTVSPGIEVVQCIVKHIDYYETYYGFELQILEIDSKMSVLEAVLCNSQIHTKFKKGFPIKF